MAYILFGGSPADMTLARETLTSGEQVLDLAPSVNLEAWNAGTGGTQVTDLKLFTGSYTVEGAAAPSGIFASQADGTVLVWAQDTLDYLFVTGQGSTGTRWLLHPLNGLQRLRAIEAAAYIPASQKGAASGVAPLDSSSKVPTANLPAGIVTGVSTVNGQSGDVTLTAASVGAIASSREGAANGIAQLGSDGKVPSTQLPPASAGNVQSVNSKTGVVVLTASDVGALAIADKGTAGGIAELDANTKVPIARIPVGLTSATVMAGNQIIPIAQATPGTNITQVWDGTGTTPNRVTNRTDIVVVWKSPVEPSNAAGKALAGVDIWLNTTP